MVSALYPGSFDPVTRGHIDLVERALELFDGVTVAVGINSSKETVFSVDERLELLRDALPASPKLRVDSFGGLLVDYCTRHGFSVILRGLRTVMDFEYEFQMALTNRELAPEIETVFVMPSARYAHLSSSLIREIVANGGDASAFLTDTVARQLKQRLDERRAARPS